MSFKKRQPAPRERECDLLVDLVLIGGFVTVVLIGLYGMVRLFKR